MPEIGQVIYDEHILKVFNGKKWRPLGNDIELQTFENYVRRFPDWSSNPTQKQLDFIELTDEETEMLNDTYFSQSEIDEETSKEIRRKAYERAMKGI